MNPNTELRKAAQHQQQGRPAEAAAAYRAVLARFPAREEAQTGLLAALEVQGDWATTEAEAEALAARSPGLVAAWLVLARARLMLGRDARVAAQRAVALAPSHAGAQDYLGIALRRAGELAPAEAAFRAALRLRPGHRSTQLNLANVLRERGALGEALRLYAEVRAAEPQRLDAIYNQALALADAGEPAAAEGQLRQLIAAAPGFAEAQAALGAVLRAAERLADAEGALRAALALDPGQADAAANLALVLHKQGKLGELAHWRGRAVALMPASSMFRLSELVMALPKVAASAQEAQAAVAAFDAGLEAYASWRTAALADGSLRHDSLACLPFYLAYRLGNHRERLSRFADLSAPATLPARPARATPAAAPGPVRLGIVSAHIRRHSVWDIVLKGLVQHLDPRRFELTIYHLGLQEDDETAWARQAVPRFRDHRDLAGSAGWADLIARDAPELLFYPEVGMHPEVYRLAQQRLAPWQAAGWGHPITTGLASMDLYVSGDLLEPPDAADHYRETLVRLPGTGCCTLPAASAPLDDVPEAADPTFLIPQGVYKFDPAFDAWLVEIARQVGAARFVIPVSDAWREPAARLAARLGAAFEQAGLSAQQLVFVPWLGEAEFRRALHEAWVFLDCPAFSGYTTAWKALREGTPLVTFEGPFMRQRLAAGLLRRVGLDDAVATDAAGYVARAVALARLSPAERQALRREMAAAASRADGDLAVVRAFEAEVLARLR